MPVSARANMFQPADMGRAMRTHESIKGQQLRNKALADSQEERQNILKNREKAAEIRSMYDSMPDQIAALERESMFEQADELRDHYIQARKTEVDLITSVRAGVNAENYSKFRQDMIQSGAITPEMLPVEYSDKWFGKEIEKKKRTLQDFTVSSFRNGAMMKRDYVTEDGNVRWDLTGNWYDDPDADKDGSGGKGGSGDDKPFIPKAADASQIGKQVERIFGGFYDPQTGMLKGLDPEESARVQAVQEEAEQIYLENEGKLSHGIAVTRAARKLGINIENYRNKAATDPLGLRE